LFPVDADYVNSSITKHLKLLHLAPKPDEKLLEQAKNELHQKFSWPTRGEQKLAALFLPDMERGEAIATEDKTLRDHITEYQAKAKDAQMDEVAEGVGLDESKLRDLLGLKLAHAAINQYARFDALKKAIDVAKSRAFFEKKENSAVSSFRATQLTDAYLRKFLLSDENTDFILISE
jgi:type I restriction enzyme R subunit